MAREVNIADSWFTIRAVEKLSYVYLILQKVSSGLFTWPLWKIPREHMKFATPGLHWHKVIYATFWSEFKFNGGDKNSTCQCKVLKSDIEKEHGHRKENAVRFLWVPHLQIQPISDRKLNIGKTKPLNPPKKVTASVLNMSRYSLLVFIL